MLVRLIQLIELEHRHELHRRDAERLEVRDLLAEAEERPRVVPAFEEDQMYAMGMPREDGEIDAAGARRGSEGSAVAARRGEGGTRDTIAVGLGGHVRHGQRAQGWGYLADHLVLQSHPSRGA